MKKTCIAILLSAVALFSAGNVSAQSRAGRYGTGPDSLECMKYLSFYRPEFKSKNYADAVVNWRVAYAKCPATASQYMLTDGTALMRSLLLKNAKNPIYKQKLVDTLLTLHDLRIENYPKYAVSTRNTKGQDIHNYVTDPKVLYHEYTKIIEANKGETKPSLFVFNFQAAKELFDAGAIDAEEILTLYDRSMELLEMQKPKTKSDSADVAKVRTDLESLFIASKVADCEQLIQLFTPRYNADPNNYEVATKIVKMMNTTDDCYNNDLYLSALTTMHTMNPSALSAYFLYKLNASRGESASAIKYLEEAIASDETDDAKDGEYGYELAVYYYKNNMAAKSFEAAKKAAALNPSYAGKCYLLMGNIWMSLPGCGGNEVTRAGKFWVACDWFGKAKAADPSLADEANKNIGRCSAYFPAKADAFMYDIAPGQGYSISCGGLSASTTVRTR